jgi:hypothetical protein
MWTLSGVLLFASLLAVPACVPGRLRWWLAVPSVLLAGFGNHALWTEMHAGLWSAIRTELGMGWVIGSFAAWNLPFAACWFWLCKLHLSVDEEIRCGGCGMCGFNLTGNVSGLCPECGTAVARRE